MENTASTRILFYSSVSWTQGFYAEECSEDKQEEDGWQAPDKLQRISNMVFLNGVQEVPWVKDGVLSSPLQHQGGGCSLTYILLHKNPPDRYELTTRENTMFKLVLFTRQNWLN